MKTYEKPFVTHEMQKAGLAISYAWGRRLIQGQCVYLNGSRVTYAHATCESGDTIEIRISDSHRKNRKIVVP